MRETGFAAPGGVAKLGHPEILVGLADIATQTRIANGDFEFGGHNYFTTRRNQQRQRGRCPIAELHVRSMQLTDDLIHLMSLLLHR